MIKKDSEEVRKKDILEKAKELEVDTKLAKQRKETAEEDYKMCEERYKKAEANKEALEASASNSFKAIANVLVDPLTLVTGSNVFNTDADLDSNSQLAREEKLLHLEEMKKQREIRSKALQDIAEFTKQIENCEDDANLAEVAIGALHKPMSGLQQLSAIMMKAALFWKQIQVHCEQLAKEKMQRMITMAMKKPKKDRLRVWTSNGFKTQAIKHHAQWVALDDVCAIYMGRIKETQSELYAYLTENLTLTEAQQKVHELAKVFGKELEMEH